METENTGKSIKLKAAFYAVFFIFILMKMASLAEIKKELQTLSSKQLIELCLRLARYKKENKELFAFLLFEAHNEESYASSVKHITDEAFNHINTNNFYLAKKALRKILRQANRYIKYSLNKQTEAEVLIHFCTSLKHSGIPLYKNKAINNMYLQQVKKIKAALASLHEDIQYDFAKQLAELQSEI